MERHPSPRAKSIRENLTLFITAYSSIAVATVSLLISWSSYRDSRKSDEPQVRVLYVDVEPKGRGSTTESLDKMLRHATHREVRVLENQIVKDTDGLKHPSYTRLLLLENVGDRYIRRLHLNGTELFYSAGSSNIDEFSSKRELSVDVPGGLKRDELIAIPLARAGENFKFYRDRPDVRLEPGATGIMLSVRELVCQTDTGSEKTLPVREKLETVLFVENLWVGK